ncbi:hypothetical protein [Halorientalis sp.]|uniref:hypothetical protein n=1 Tax=Halorientalis sp. TaxID=1931229 RepID=UPI002626514F|nr:hypothetical protein [Halorientalis sp.]
MSAVNLDTGNQFRIDGNNTGHDPLGAVTVTRQEPPGGVEGSDSRTTVDADAANSENVRFSRVANGTLPLTDPLSLCREDGEHVVTFRSEGPTRLLVAVDRQSTTSTERA